MRFIVCAHVHTRARAHTHTHTHTHFVHTQELIPEFFLPGGKWLVNAQRLPLGVRQNGQAVGDVLLPPWAQGGIK
jgi:hypothetical protein